MSGGRPSLVLVQGREKSLMRRHPWIFSGAVKRIVGNPQEGDLVDVVGSDGRWLAVGHYQNDSIICKVLSFETADIDDSFWLARIQSAVDYRRRLGFFDMKNTNVFRLVHAEGDFLPGLVADYYNGVVVLQAHSVGMHRELPRLANMFSTVLGEKLVAVFDKSSATVPGGSTDGYIMGDAAPEREVVESGNRLLINFYEGQKTGFFIDQRENRKLVQDLSHGHRVLNCFGYTGGFSLGALRGGADYVETVDISKRAIELCNRNVDLNFGSDERHRGVVADVLQYIQTIKQSSNQAFDFIILDPPAFAKNHRSLQQGLKGYRNINQKALEHIAKGGLLMTFSCSQAVSTDDFRTMVFTAAATIGRRVRVVRQLPHAMDHPVSIYHPEGEYLKGLLLQVD